MLWGLVLLLTVTTATASVTLSTAAVNLLDMLRNVTQSDQCFAALEKLFDGLLAREIWALKMVDASSKVPAGLLEGNIVDLGSYDECLAVTVGHNFTGQYCLISIRASISANASFASPALLKTLGNSMTYTSALCLPSICSPAQVAHSLSDLTKKINSTLVITVQESDCYTSIIPPLRLPEVLGIVVTLGLVLLVVTSTIIDLTLMYQDKESNPKGMQVLTAWSVMVNGRRLLNTQTQPGSLPALQGLKLLSICWVLLGHRARFSVQAPLDNLFVLPQYLENLFTMVYLNATLSVEVFFVVSGVLNAYMYLGLPKHGRMGLFSHLGNYLHRYIRLTPAYAVMVIVTGSWLYRTGDGPLWNRMVGSARAYCTDYWWSNLLYINNYYNPNSNCMMQSWYLAADMQMFWLSPLVLYPLRRWPRIGLAVLLISAFVGIVVPFEVAFTYLIKTPIPITFDQDKVNQEMAELYFPTHTKIISYIVGILSGYFIHLVKSEKVKFYMSKSCACCLWVLALACMGGALLGGYPLFQLDYTYSRWQSSAYISLFRLFWSSGVAWIVIACASGYGGFVSTVLSWKAFIPLGRLTYCIYLTHVAVILYTTGSMRRPEHISYHQTIFTSLGDFVVSTVLAVVLTLVVEAPILTLEKILTKRRNRTSFPSTDGLGYQNTK